MLKENEFGNVYHQINFSSDQLEAILAEMHCAADREEDEEYLPIILNIIDRIEKELGIG